MPEKKRGPATVRVPRRSQPDNPRDLPRCQGACDGVRFEMPHGAHEICIIDSQDEWHYEWCPGFGQ